MPNHVSTNLKIVGPADDVQKFVNAVNLSEQKAFDFNGLVPMPKELLNSRSPVLIQTQDEIDAKWVEYNKKKEAGKLTPYEIGDGKPWDIGITKEAQDELIAKHGCDNWYDWALEHWGTKWGAYDDSGWQLDIDSSNKTAIASISYNTAWSPAHEFFMSASEQFPNLTFETEYADEGGGFVCETVYSNGNLITDESYEWDSEDGIRVRTNVGYYDTSEDSDESNEFVTTE